MSKKTNAARRRRARRNLDNDKNEDVATKKANEDLHNQNFIIVNGIKYYR